MNDRVLPALMVRAGSRDPRADARRRRGSDVDRAPVRHPAHGRRRAADRTPSIAGGPPDARAASAPQVRRPAVAGLTVAVRDRLHGGRRGDLLLAGRRRRSRAGNDAVRLPVRRRDVRPRGHDLRRGLVVAPGPRRRDGLRALRLQRGVVVHRRLGDDPRLHDPARGHRVLGDELPGSVSPPVRLRRTGAGAVLRDPRLRRGAQHPRLLAHPREPDHRAGDHGHRDPGGADRAGADQVLQLPHADRPDPPRPDRRNGTTCCSRAGSRRSCSPGWSRRRGSPARWASGAPASSA